MLVPTWPVDQTTRPAHPVAVSVAEPPKQINVLVQEMVGGAGTPIEMVAGPDGSLTHEPMEHVAVKIKVLVGFTEIVAPVAPVDHRTKPSQPVAVTRAVSPAQMVAVRVASRDY